jgi:hypothetical protein
LGELALKHKRSASDIWLLRERYLSLLTDLAADAKPIDELRKKRDELVTALHTVYAGSPNTACAAYRKAQEAVQRHEDMTFSDAEIDAFLSGERSAKSSARGTGVAFSVQSPASPSASIGAWSRRRSCQASRCGSSQPFG